MRRCCAAARHRGRFLFTQAAGTGAAAARFCDAQPRLCQPQETARGACGGHPSADRRICRAMRRFDPLRRPFHGRAAGAPLHRQPPSAAACPRRHAGHAQRRQRGRRSPEGPFDLPHRFRPGRHAAFDYAGRRAGRLATIASLLVLPRPNDGRVSVASSKLAGMADHVVVKASHTGLPRHPAAIDQTIAFLYAGRFRSPAHGEHSVTP